MTVSAPGKLLLLGDHAVVYGYPCITTAVSERLEVTIEETGDGKITVDAPQVKDTRFVDAAIDRGLRDWNIRHNGFRLVTKSAFSETYGFGSSSAVTVATLYALASLFKKDFSTRQIFDMAYQIVLTIQGVGSGFDVASAAFGGTIYYVKGGKVIKHLGIKDMPLVVGYTGIKSNTVDLVRMVGKKRKQYPEKVERIFQGITKLVDEAKARMIDGDWERIGRLMDFNQEYLRDLGVSSQKLEDLIRAAKKAGAWGAKLSGAGGGDCMIAVVAENKRTAAEEAITKAGGEVIRVATGAQGAAVETTDDQQELFIVVDKNDNIIGYKTRCECHHDKTLIHRGINVLLFDSQGRVLLQKRSLTKDTNAGYWSTSVGGHVVKDETYEQAALREMKEELGVETAITLKTKFIHNYPHETEMETLFTGYSKGPFRPDPQEVELVQFFSKDEIPRRLLSGELRLTSLAEHSLKLVGFL